MVFIAVYVIGKYLILGQNFYNIAYPPKLCDLLPRFWVKSFKNKFSAEQDIFFVKCQLDYLCYMKSKKYCIILLSHYVQKTRVTKTLIKYCKIFTTITRQLFCEMATRLTMLSTFCNIIIII